MSDYSDFFDLMEKNKPVSLDDLIVFKDPNDKEKVLFKLSKILRRSFFWYQGSLSSPPCTEGISRFVLKNAIYIPSSQFRFLKDSAYPSGIEVKGNARESIPMASRLVYFHEDLSEKCADYEKMLKSSESGSSNATKIDIKHFDPRWLKATTKMTTYGYTKNTNIPNFNGEEIYNPDRHMSYKISIVGESKVPVDTLGRLKKKAGEMEYQIRRLNEDVYNSVNETSPSIVVTKQSSSVETAKHDKIKQSISV